jgi:hypothetical protein
VLKKLQEALSTELHFPEHRFSDTGMIALLFQYCVRLRTMTDSPEVMRELDCTGCSHASLPEAS